jgi:hypothetical protein
MRSVATLLGLVMVVLLSPLPAAAQASSPSLAAPYTPLVLGWEQFFKITWEPFQRNGRPYIGGYVLNDWGFPSRRVQLLVDGLDSSGRVVSQRIVWLGQELTPGSRAYFEIRAPQPASGYRVSVFAFDWMQAASIQAP